MAPPHERASLPQRTTSNPFASAQKTSWGDTRAREADRRRACIYDIPRETTLDQIKVFFGLECLEGIHLKQTKLGLMAFVQFRRESDYTSAILRSGQQFLNTGCKIIIRPWEEQQNGSKRRKLTPTRALESPPRRQYRERSRSRTSSPSWIDHSRRVVYRRPSSRQRDIADRSLERRHQSRNRSPSPRRSTGSARTPARSSHSFDWGNGWGTPDLQENAWGSTESRSFNRYDEPNVTMRQLETKTLPPNSHSFGLATIAPATSLPLGQTSSSLAVVAVSQSNSLAIASSNHNSFVQQHGQQQQLQLQPLVEYDRTNNNNNQMPQSIILLLGYVIQAKSAQSLSMTQLDEIIGFFEETKKKLETRDDNTQRSSSSATNCLEEPRPSALDPRLSNGHFHDGSDTNAEELIKKLKGIH